VKGVPSARLLRTPPSCFITQHFEQASQIGVVVEDEIEWRGGSKGSIMGDKSSITVGDATGACDGSVGSVGGVGFCI